MSAARIAERLRRWARAIKRDAVSLWFACRDARTPWAVKALCAFVVAYALSPIDLIPDFVPVLGYLDDVLLLPGLVWLAIRLLPSTVLHDCRARAADWMASRGKKPVSAAGIVLVAIVWAAAAYGAWRLWGRAS
jgi:uncharacterized membrane protein YkvA (DUF1232 family)